jgi:hypothetical protein
MEAMRPVVGGLYSVHLFHPRAPAWMSAKALFKASVVVRASSRVVSGAEADAAEARSTTEA